MTDYWMPGATVNLSVTVNGCSGTCRLNGWIDWNNDGDFLDTGEQVLSEYGIGDGTGQNVSISIPSDYITGTDVYARFRLCSATGQCNTYYGSAPDGEVEDYFWGYGSTAVGMNSLQATVKGTAWPYAAVLILALLTAAWMGWRWLQMRQRP
jgi:hypothetical protein